MLPRNLRVSQGVSLNLGPVGDLYDIFAAVLGPFEAYRLGMDWYYDFSDQDSVTFEYQVKAEIGGDWYVPDLEAPGVPIKDVENPGSWTCVATGFTFNVNYYVRFRVSKNGISNDWLEPDGQPYVWPAD